MFHRLITRLYIYNLKYMIKVSGLAFVRNREDYHYTLPALKPSHYRFQDSVIGHVLSALLLKM